SSSIPMHIPQDERYPSLPGQIDSATASPLSSDIVPGMSMAPAITLPTNSMPIVCQPPLIPSQTYGYAAQSHTTSNVTSSISSSDFSPTPHSSQSLGLSPYVGSIMGLAPL